MPQPPARAPQFHPSLGPPSPSGYPFDWLEPGPAPIPPVLPYAGQPAGVRVSYQRAGSAQASPVQQFQGTGSPFYPLNRPASAVTRPLPPRGRVRSNPGVYDQVGPPFYPDSSPVAAGGTSAASSSRNGARLPPRGRVASNPGLYGQLGPVVYPLQHPVAAVTRPLPRRGRTSSNAGTRAQSGPPVYPLLHPVQARRPLPPRGRTGSNPGTFTAVVQQTAPLYPLQGPVRAASRPLPRRGRAESLGGTFEGTGPAVRSLQHPVAAASRPLPPRGRVYHQSGTYQGAGPQITPPQGPVRAAFRFRPPRGRSLGSPGTRGQTGPPVKPLAGPVVAHRYTLPPRGRDLGVVRALPYQPGPPVYPLKGPVRARQPLPPRGRDYQTPPHVAATVPAGTGYPFKAALQQARWSATTLPAREPSQAAEDWYATILSAPSVLLSGTSASLVPASALLDEGGGVIADEANLPIEDQSG